MSHIVLSGVQSEVDQKCVAIVDGGDSILENQILTGNRS